MNQDQIEKSQHQMNLEIELWAFVHAFQQSPVRYLHLSKMQSALAQMQAIHLPELISILEVLEEGEPWWLELLEKTENLRGIEAKAWRSDYRLVFYGQKNFPVPLTKITDAPLALSYQGDISMLQGESLGIVGSREPHALTIEWMQRELAVFLERERPCVISGGARGVDQKAHFLATWMELPTAVVLPSGLAKKYPSIWEEAQWKNKSIVFISELPFAEKISKTTFASRNRLIAAWGLATLIIEAQNRSGTLITAHHALISGKELWVVPGHPLMTSFAGSLDLILHNAQLVRDATDMSMFFNIEKKRISEFSLGLGENY